MAGNRYRCSACSAMAWLRGHRRMLEIIWHTRLFCGSALAADPHF